ncbi:MAG: hypothetical protein HW394_1129, partial [Acidobacteria bacterium]|nr:hypothetical protein [Acidobacteriota bacterium]
MSRLRQRRVAKRPDKPALAERPASADGSGAQGRLAATFARLRASNHGPGLVT